MSTELTRFVGRSRELLQLSAVVDSSRLITLTGAGGAGKTRVALELAEVVRPKFPDGVWVTELASVGPSSGIAQRIASTIGINQASSAPPVDVLVARLGACKVLLILDGCEHIVEDCVLVVDALLRQCPNTKVLVTSQEPLGVAGEYVWRVPALTLPSGNEWPECRDSDAVQLFLDRAQLVDAAFTLNPDNCGFIAEICRQLDGMPLAIELAAARTRLLTPAEILVRLEHRFRLLVGGSRTALPRHQTLRAAVAWSYDQLSKSEQLLFRRLSVFQAGFTVEAAEAVCGVEPLNQDLLLPLLERLRDRAMIVQVPNSMPGRRHRMLETLRLHAGELLNEFADETEQLRNEHSTYYLRLACEAGRHMNMADQREWLRRVDEDSDNIRAALAWARGNNLGAAAHAVAALRPYWVDVGLIGEGRVWAASVLERLEEHSPVRAKVLVAAAALGWANGDVKFARHYAAVALAAALWSGDDETLATAYVVSGVVESHSDAVRAIDHHRRALEIRERLGDQWGIAVSLNNMGLVAYDQGDYDTALKSVSQAVPLAESTGNPRLLTVVYESLARIRLAMGRIAESESSARVSLRNAAEFSKPLVAAGLENLAALAVVRGQYSRALTLGAAASAVRSETGGQHPANWQDSLAGRLAQARKALGEGAAAEAWQEGLNLTLADAVALGMGSRSADSADAAESGGSDLLTKRQLEVAQLVALGRTNKEIASSLLISVRTADSHIQHIMERLGFHSRAEIAVWAERLNGHTHR